MYLVNTVLCSRIYNQIANWRVKLCTLFIICEENLSVLFLLWNIRSCSELRPLTFRVVCTDGQTEVTFALALLHGCWPLMFQTLIGRLAGVGQTLHRTLLLTQTTLCRTLRHKHTEHIWTGDFIVVQNRHWGPIPVHTLPSRLVPPYCAKMAMNRVSWFLLG